MGGRFITLIILIGILILVIELERRDFDPGGDVVSNFFNNNPEYVLYKYSVNKVHHRRGNCTFYNCFDINRCSLHTGNIKVHIYPTSIFWNGEDSLEQSTEFLQIIDAIYTSKFYTDNPEEACLFIPSVDTLNLHNNRNDLESVLSNLKYWNKGQNHLIFNFIGDTSLFGIDQAILASPSFSSYSYRPLLDVSLPLYVPDLPVCGPTTAPCHPRHTLQPPNNGNPLGNANPPNNKNPPNIRNSAIIRNPRTGDQQLAAGNPQLSSGPQQLVDPWQRRAAERPFKLLVFPTQLDTQLQQQMQTLSELNPDIVLAQPCQTKAFCVKGERYSESELLLNSQYCFVTGAPSNLDLYLFKALQQGCVPVILQLSSILPFSEIIDWSLISIRVRRKDIKDLSAILSKPKHIYSSMQYQLGKIYKTYMSSPAAIALSTLQIINARIYTHTGVTIEDWNLVDSVKSPLFLDRYPRPNTGFTAVILSYDRLESLFQIITQISEVGSLSRILVVWNHQSAPPPPADQWPKVNKQLKVVQTTANKLSNRFYPYPEIDTECVLSLDDDITMLTSDEIEFGFQVWREFPDRIIGFPSRTHYWNQSTGSWSYESEWKNEHSMILTGAAFYNKYWNYVYTAAPNINQKHIRDWVDSNMNCEDIAFNFLVANQTGKPIIKIGPRKKFRCATPSCENGSMLSSDAGHLALRSQCVERFAKLYGGMPLKNVEYRFDPVLYKDHYPANIQKFPQLGPL